jgi:hypothetical protein
MPRYIYGRDQRDKIKPLRIGMNFAASSKVTLQLKTADGMTPTAVELSCGAESRKIDLRPDVQDVTVDVPAGQQKLEIASIGIGSAELTKTTIQATHAPLIGIGYVGKEVAFGYVYDATLDDFSSNPAPTYKNVTIRLPGLAAGSYEATLVDPKSGIDIAPVKFDAGGAGISIPTITADLAFKVHRVKTKSE